MKFCVVGAGAWGTAFALHLARSGHGVTLAPRRAAHADALRTARENADYLPGVPLPPELKITSDLPVALADAEVVFLACPAQALRETGGRLRAAWKPAAPPPRFVVGLAKGLEMGTHLRPSQVLSAVLPSLRIGALTGPSNAGEVARCLPAAMVLATAQPEAAAEVQAAISSATLRIYTSDDLAGVEFGGALKNIYAIASGCCDGLGLGDNARAALLTRALAEMVRVGTALGARLETFYGLGGFGDLVATCHADWSRNREFGRHIGEGRAVAEILANRKTVVEGYLTTDSFAGLCAERRIEAPILHEMRAILFAGRRPADALAALMARGLKRETPAPAR